MMGTSHFSYVQLGDAHKLEAYNKVIILFLDI